MDPMKAAARRPCLLTYMYWVQGYIAFKSPSPGLPVSSASLLQYAHTHTHTLTRIHTHAHSTRQTSLRSLGVAWLHDAAVAANPVVHRAACRMKMAWFTLLLRMPRPHSTLLRLGAQGAALVDAARRLGTQISLGARVRPNASIDMDRTTDGGRGRRWGRRPRRWAGVAGPELRRARRSIRPVDRPFRCLRIVCNCGGLAQIRVLELTRPDTGARFLRCANGGTKLLVPLAVCGNQAIRFCQNCSSADRL